MIKTLDQWVVADPITSDEEKTLFPTEELLDSKNGDMSRVCSKLLDLVGLEHNQFCVDLDGIGATQIINRLFQLYSPVGEDKETFVVASDLEHNSVRANLDKIPDDNKYIIKNYEDVIHLRNFDVIVQDILDKCGDKPRILVYINGMQNAFMIQTPQSFYEYLKERLIESGKQVILCIDAVQELFLTRRDYSIFDIIIGTAHATISNFNLGMVFRRMDKIKTPLGDSTNQSKRLDHFLDELGILLKRGEKLHSFKYVMSDYFRKNCPFKYVELDTVDYGFSILIKGTISRDEYKYFDDTISRKYDIAISPFPYYTIIRFRAPSLMLGLNFNNDKRSRFHLSLDEGIKKVFLLGQMILDRQ